MGFAGLGSYKMALALTPALLAAAWGPWDPEQEAEPRRQPPSSPHRGPRSSPRARPARRSPAPGRPWRWPLACSSTREARTFRWSRRRIDTATGAWRVTSTSRSTRAAPRPTEAYRYPVPMTRRLMVSGYDFWTVRTPSKGGAPPALRRPRRDRHRRRARHEGALVALEHQVGDAEVLFTGHLFGETVITCHTVREAGALRTYVVLYSTWPETRPWRAAKRSSPAPSWATSGIREASMAACTCTSRSGGSEKASIPPASSRPS